VSRHAQHDGWS